MKTLNILSKTSAMLLMIVVLQIVGGCKASNSTKGTAIGASAGGVLGGFIGSRSDNTALGAIIGAAVGGTTGVLIGNHMDKQAAELKGDLSGADVQRVGEGIKITFDSGLMFGFDSYALTASTKTNLSNLAKTLNKYEDTDIIIEGHTDASGAADYNMKLSIDRSSAVSNYLQVLNVKSGRLTNVGYGETQPISTVDQANRRVEVAIFANNRMKRAAKNGRL
jgi:outer membrane protein OmpA-like peptidoglycan-associated protein